MIGARIAFFLPSLNIGGIERVFITYANHLSNYIENVDFVLCKKEGALLDELSNSVTLHNLGNVRLLHSYTPLRKYIKQYKPDYLLSGGDYPNMMSILACVGLTTKVIISQHNYFNIEIKQLGFFAHFSKLWMRILYPFSYKIIAISSGINQFLEKELHLNPNNIVQIYNPINFTSIQKAAEAPITIDLPKNFIVFIGRLSVVKNLFFLLDAFNKADLGDCKLLIVGDGDQMLPLQSKVSSLAKKNDIIFTGSLSNPLSILKKAKALVLPSFSEAFPTILLEALSLNIKIISTPTKGATEILDRQSFCYISKSFDDITEFALLLQQAYVDKAEYVHHDLRKYDCDVVCSQFIKECLTIKENSI